MEIKNVLLSIKPRFALQIIGGTKTIELRRKFTTDQVIGGVAIIYASSPLQKIVGYAHIENVLFLTLDEIWFQYGEQSKVKQDFFYQYYDGLTHGFALHLIKPVHLEREISLKELKNKYNITPPQSYRYLSSEILSSLLA